MCMKTYSKMIGLVLEKVVLCSLGVKWVELLRRMGGLITLNFSVNSTLTVITSLNNCYYRINYLSYVINGRIKCVFLLNVSIENGNLRIILKLFSASFIIHCALLCQLKI